MQLVCRDYIENSSEFKELNTELFKWWNSLDEKPPILFSGSKGYHIYVKMDLDVDYSKEIIEYAVGAWLSDPLIKYWDKSVTLDKRRRMRVPGSVNHKTGYKCLLVHEDYNVRNNELERLFENYEEIIKKERVRQGQTRQIQKENWQKVRNTGKKIDLDRINLIDVADELIGDGRVSGDGKLFKCPWHNDTHPSLMVYPNGWICGGCPAKGNKLEFLEQFGIKGKDRFELLKKYL